jgi:hypothetical protein
MDAMMVAAIGGFALVSAAVSVMIAAGKHRRILVWGPVGLLLNLPGMLVVTVLPAALPRPARETVMLAESERAERPIRTVAV